MMTTFMVQLTCVSSVVRAEGPSGGSPVTAAMEQITTLVAKVTQLEEQMREQAVQMAKQDVLIAALRDEMEKKDEAVAARTNALKAKADHGQAKVSPAEVDTEQTGAQDAKIGMAVSEIGEDRSAISPLPSVATPGRRMETAPSDDNYVNEISVTGPTAVVSWNGYTPGRTSFNCTGVGDGKLTCSGELHVPDVFIAGYDTGLVSKLDEMTAAIGNQQGVTRNLQEAVTQYLPGYSRLLAPPIPVSSATDGVDRFTKLDGAYSVATFAIGVSTYAAVAGGNVDKGGLQLIDLSDPSSPVAVGSATDGEDGFNKLKGGQCVATFVIGASTYAIVAARHDNGVQLIDVSDPRNPVAVSSMADDVDGFDVLDGAEGVATFVIGPSTYAIVASFDDNGVQLIDVSDPNSPVAVGSATDGVGGFTKLVGPVNVATFVIGASTYAIVTSHSDDGVQLIDVSDPSSPVAVGSATDGVGGFTELDGAREVTTFVIGASTYAIVTGFSDNGVQVLQVGA